MGIMNEFIWQCMVDVFVHRNGKQTIDNVFDWSRLTGGVVIKHVWTECWELPVYSRFNTIERYEFYNINTLRQRRRPEYFISRFKSVFIDIMSPKSIIIIQFDLFVLEFSLLNSYSSKIDCITLFLIAVFMMWNRLTLKISASHSTWSSKM